MRYLRTDYEIYDINNLYVCEELIDKPYATKNGHWCIYRDSIRAEADDIRQLCDEFVIIDAMGEHIVVRKENELEQLWLKNHSEDCTVYGAIWTPKGLMYAAKEIDGEWRTL